MRLSQEEGASRSYMSLPLHARVLPTRSEMQTTLIAQRARFACPNIQIYDAHVSRTVPMGLCPVSRRREECRCERKARLSLALDGISERITLASNPKDRSGAIKNEILFIFQLHTTKRERIRTLEECAI